MLVKEYEVIHLFFDTLPHYSTDPFYKTWYFIFLLVKSQSTSFEK